MLIQALRTSTFRNIRDRVSPPKEVSRSKLPIHPRRANLDFGEVRSDRFAADNAPLSAMVAALSSGFPFGEQMFIKSVRAVLPKVTDAKLRSDVRAFAAQEAHHSSEHEHFNEKLHELGFPVKELEEWLVKYLTDKSERWSEEMNLANTVVMEHITATLAHYTLTHPAKFLEGPEAVSRLLFWHSIEEIEHKAVAFDVYTSTGGSMVKLRLHMLVQLILFPTIIGRMVGHSLRTTNSKPSRAEWNEALWFWFGRKGFVTASIPHLLLMALPGFHPWDVDDQELCNEWKRRLSLEDGVAQSAAA